MANKVQFGLSEVRVAFLTEATGVYGAPVEIPGAVKLSLAPEGGEYKMYADNGIYFNNNANNGYTGDLECALLPDSVKAEMLGWEVDTNGVLVEKADGAQKPFALLYEVDGDANNKRYAFYKCIASRPTTEHNTKAETVSPDTAKLSIQIVPIEFDDVSVVGGSVENVVGTAAVYAAWYTAVTKPDWASA